MGGFTVQLKTRVDETKHYTDIHYVNEHQDGVSSMLDIHLEWRWIQGQTRVYSVEACTEICLIKWIATHHLNHAINEPRHFKEISCTVS